MFGAILATGCVTVDGGSDGMVKVEFEDGEWEGNIVMNAQPDNPENDGEIGSASGDFFGHNWGYTWFDYVTVESLM